MDKRRREADWAEAKRRCRLNAETLRMAKELGLNPRSLIKNIPNKSQPWSRRTAGRRGSTVPAVQTGILLASAARNAALGEPGLRDRHREMLKQFDWGGRTQGRS
jgi:hypothetical protein